MKWGGMEISEFALMPDGTVEVVFPDGSKEIWGYWKGKWIKEEDTDDDANIH